MAYPTSLAAGLAERAPRSRREKFALFAWTVLGWNLLVILWGAFVRATGSGAGCGSHWPLCNGEVVPRSPQIETIIEFAHRTTSGVALLLVAGLVVGAYRLYPRQHVVRRGAMLSLVFILLEALIGAGLVLFRLVAGDTSVARAVYLSGHLINTLILVAVLALTAWWASGGSRLHFAGPLRGLIAAAIAGTLLLGVSGAITALGDTLFPVSSLAEGIRQDATPTAHFLIRLRIFHPLIAILVSLLLLWTSRSALRLRTSEGVRRWARFLTAAVIAELMVGLLNLWLLAPTWMQLVHLLFADLLWIALVLLSAEVLSAEMT